MLSTWPEFFSWVRSVQFTDGGFITATLVMPSTRGRNASIFPSGDIRGFIAFTGPPRRVPDQLRAESPVRNRTHGNITIRAETNSNTPRTMAHRLVRDCAA